MKYEYDEYDDRCPDCNTLVTATHTPPGTHNWHWYFVYNEVWAAAGLTRFDAGCFCIPCLERRLGRPLTAADFPPVPLNDPDVYDDTPYLHELKLEVAELHPDGDWLQRNQPPGVDPPPPRFWRLRDAALEALATVKYWLRLP
jgi:hypothetical protein